MLGHTGAVSANGKTVSSVTSRISQVIFSAPDLKGTPLANQVTTSGSFLNIANSVVEFFGGGSYNNPAVVQQRTDNMSVYNSNGTFAGGPGRRRWAASPSRWCAARPSTPTSSRATRTAAATCTPSA